MLVFQSHYNDSKNILKKDIEDVRLKLTKYNPVSLTGSNYRNGILKCIKANGWNKKKFKHPTNPTIGIDTISKSINPTGLCIQVSHTDAGKAQLLDFEVLYRDSKVKGCIFVTQTFAEATKRNFEKNPTSGWGKTGNRIHYEYLNEQMVSLQKFMKCPITIIGIQSDEEHQTTI